MTNRDSFLASTPAVVGAAASKAAAIKVLGWKLMRFGDLAVDSQLRVIRKAGAPIKTLFTAGDILGAGAPMGRRPVGGMCATPALTPGRLLGQKMLDFPKRA